MMHLTPRDQGGVNQRGFEFTGWFCTVRNSETAWVEAPLKTTTVIPLGATALTLRGPRAIRLRRLDADVAALQLQQAPFAQAVEEYGEEDDAGQHHRLQVEVDLDEDHACLHHLHQHRADDGTEYRGDATAQASAAEHCGRGHP